MNKFLNNIKQLYLKHPGQFWAGALLIFILIIVSSNRMFDLKLGELLKEESRSRFIQKFQRYVPKSKIRVDEKFKDKVIRRSYLDPNRKFSFSLVYLNGEEIARYKSNNDIIFDFEGNIPNGAVKFFNETEQRYGEEIFKQNQRHGYYREFYKDGQKYREAKFAQGKLMLNKVYYIDGTLRMEEDRYDALRLVDDKEAGTGKIYYRDGKLMYEWSLTNVGQGGYKKSYNQIGQLTEVKKYDKNGKMISVERIKR